MAVVNQLLREQDKASANIDRVELPLTQDASRVARLDDFVKNGSQAVDPVIAPELLQVVTKGKGRMSEAEIARILGGPDALTKFNRFIGAWNSDPNYRYAEQPEMLQQMGKIVNVLQKRNDLKLDAINRATKELEDTTNPSKVLSVTNKLKKELSAIDSQEIKPTIKIKGLVP